MGGACEDKLRGRAEMPTLEGGFETSESKLTGTVEAVGGSNMGGTCGAMLVERAEVLTFDAGREIEGGKL